MPKPENPQSAQIISRRRVAEHGEVFTAEREVRAMCDLVGQECERIASRFLEPACELPQRIITKYHNGDISIRDVMNYWAEHWK